MRSPFFFSSPEEIIEKLFIFFDEVIKYADYLSISEKRKKYCVTITKLQLFSSLMKSL